MSKKYEELEFTDNFMFEKIMYDNPDLCRELLELILQKPIERISYTQYENPIEIRPDAKGIRMDVFTRDEEGTIYDIEMQVENEKDIARRSRYYHGMIDLDQMEKGEKYSQLNDAYVIFICKNRPGEGYTRPVYTFCYQSREEPERYLDDGTWTILLNADCDDRDLSEELKAFLAYVRTGETEGEEESLANRLDRAVKDARLNREWRLEYMTLEQMLKEQYQAGVEAEHEKTIVAEQRAEEERRCAEEERRRAEEAERKLAEVLAELKQLKNNK